MDFNQHITVSLSSSHGKDWNPLKCITCGNFVCQYNEDFVRSITYSGEPITERPGKVIKCSGVIKSYNPKDTLEMMYELFDTIQKANNVEEIQTKVVELSRDNHQKSKMCKTKYFVS